MITLLEGEKIVLMRRRHWFVIASEAAIILLMALAPFALFFSSLAVFPQAKEFLSSYLALIIFYIAIWLQFLWMFFFTAWTNYYLDVLLVTNKRVVDIEQIGLFKRDIAELRLESIQDIKIEVIGIIQSLLKMGNLHIQTAGYSKEVLLRNVPEPYKIKDLISAQYDQITHKSIPYVGQKT